MHVEVLESRLTPTPWTGLGYNLDPFPGFSGPVEYTWATGSDAVTRLVVAAGEGGGPRVRVYDLMGPRAGQWTADFFAFEPQFTGGVHLTSVPSAAGDRLVLSAGAGGGPVVLVTDLGGTQIARFFAYDPAYTGGFEVHPSVTDPAGLHWVLLTVPDAGGADWRVFEPDGAADAGFFVGPRGADASAVRPVPAGLGVQVAPGVVGFYAEAADGTEGWTFGGVRVS